MKWRYYSVTKGDWHMTYTEYFKVAVNEKGENVGELIPLTYQEYCLGTGRD
jgi:hypothetical protein